MSFEEIQSKIASTTNEIGSTKDEKKTAKEKLKSLEESLAKELDNVTRKSYLSQVSSLLAKEAALDAQLAELQKLLALYEQRELELSKPLQTTMTSKALTSLKPEAQERLWKSVIRVSTCAGQSTGLVIADRDNFVFILTNLHLWTELDKFLDSKTLLEIEQLKEILCFDMETLNLNVDLNVTITPRVLIERLNIDNHRLEKVVEFDLTKDMCYKSSAENDYLILKIKKPVDWMLRKADISFNAYYTLPVHILGFPGSSEQKNINDFDYSIIPGQIAGIGSNVMHLSFLTCPRFSGGAVVCTTSGVVLGYIAEGLQTYGEDDPNHHYATYAYMMHGLPPLFKFI